MNICWVLTFLRNPFSEAVLSKEWEIMTASVLMHSGQSSWIFRQTWGFLAWETSQVFGSTEMNMVRKTRNGLMMRGDFAMRNLLGTGTWLPGQNNRFLKKGIKWKLQDADSPAALLESWSTPWADRSSNKGQKYQLLWAPSARNELSEDQRVIITRGSQQPHKLGSFPPPFPLCLQISSNGRLSWS